MKRTDIEDRVRKITWPGPSASLRARVVGEDASANRPTAWPARVASDVEAQQQGQIPIAAMAPHFLAGWRRAGGLAALGIILMLGGCSGLDLWAGQEVEREIAALEARYGSLDEATLNLPAVPESDNRAIVVKAAGAVTVPLQTGRYFRNVNQEASSPVPADLRAFAEANRSAILLAEGVRTRSQSNWEVDYRGPTGWISEESWKGLLTLLDAIYVTTLMEMETGRAEEAAHAIASGLAVSTSLAHEPSQSLQYIRMDLSVGRLSRAIRRLVTELEPSRASLEDLAHWIAETRSPDPMLVGMLSQLKETNAVMVRLENGDVDRKMVSFLYSSTWPSWGQAYVVPVVRMSRPIVRMARARYLRHVGLVLDALAGPRPFPAGVTFPEPPRWAVVDRLTFKFAGGVGMNLEAGDDLASERAAAELAVALRRYRLDQGEYPDELSALVPRYLVSLPIDPFTGRPAVYGRQGAGFTLRAVGSRPEGRRAWRALEWNVPK